MRASYVAIIETDEDGGFSVFFPDLPGCVSAGESIEEAFAAAEEALNGHLAVMAEHGEQIPAPTPFGQVTIEPDIQVVAKILVPAELPGRTVRINITMDSNLLARIDAQTANRSAFLSDAARRLLPG
jgi:predicted RNase H-like HicB family nuclease